MRWDDFLGDETPGETSGPLPTLPESPPGKPWVGEIIKAYIAAKDFTWAKGDNNKAGMCLVLEIDVPKFRPVESTIPCHFAGKIAAMCRSARVHPPGAGEDWDEGQLVGKTVTFESVTVVSPKGNEYARVQKWLPNAAPLPKESRKPVARSQAAKAHKEAVSDVDDIPF